MNENRRTEDSTRNDHRENHDEAMKLQEQYNKSIDVSDNEENQDIPQRLVKYSGNEKGRGRRESIFYRSSIDSFPLSLSRKVSLTSDVFPEDQLITPFAQVLQSLRYSRQNLQSILEHVSNNNKRSGKDITNKREWQLLNGLRRQTNAAEENMVISNGSHLSIRNTAGPKDSEVVIMCRECVDEIEWCMIQLQRLHARRSVSDMTTLKFKRILSRELNAFSEGGSSASEVSEFISSTFLEDKHKEFVDDDDVDRMCSSASTSNMTLKEEVTKNRPARTSVIRKNSAPPFFHASYSETPTRRKKSVDIPKVDLGDLNFLLLRSFWFRLENACLEDSAYNDTCGELINMLSKSDDWSFDLFRFDQISGHQPILFLASYLFHKNSWLSLLKIPTTTLFSFLHAVETNYNNHNRYHNNVHAADVLQATYSMAMQPVLENVFSSLELLAVIIAACVHDIDHPGVSNQFLVNSETDLALLYNDRSVLENHHCHIAFKIIKETSCNIFARLPPRVYKTVRRLIIDMVLATDMSLHLKLVADLKTAIETQLVINLNFQHLQKNAHHNASPLSQMPLEQLSIPQKMRASQTKFRTASLNINNEDGEEDIMLLDLENIENTTQILQTLLHCADLANPTRPLRLYKKWVACIMAEFQRQGDMERDLGIEISPMCSKGVDVRQAQVGFIDYIVLPLWEAWDELMDRQCYFALDNLTINRDFYANNDDVCCNCDKPTIDCCDA